MSAKHPKNESEARRWIRLHWAELIENADIGAGGEMENNPLIPEVWRDECLRIVDRLRRGKS